MTISFVRLWNNHPTNQTPPNNNPCQNASGNPSYTNQCAIRLGVALTDSGVNLTGYSGVFCWHGHGRIHTLRAEQLATWLDKASNRTNFGTPTKRSGVTSSDYTGRQGLALFKNFWGTGNQGDHIDLWNGTRLARGEASYFGLSEEVWFWEL